MRKRVLVAMSGGVDSSVTAALLKDQGYDVCGVTMKLIDNQDSCSATPKSCCGYDSTRDARLVADVLQIPHYTVNSVDIFRKTVIDNFLQEYMSGRTPNPCIRCNQFVKFDFLFRKARELDCEILATGHYAIMQDGILRRGSDIQKDQSYFLYPVYRAPAGAVLFPVGMLTKPEVRALAASYGLPNAKRSESQDICFVPDGEYGAFLRKNGVQSAPGSILDVKGTVVGTHTGIQDYTIGQRKGLGALGRRMFVKEIRPAQNCIVAADNHELAANAILVRDVIAGRVPFSNMESCMIQIRYRTGAVSGSVERCDTNSVVVRFDKPVRAVAPGQSAVIYRDDIVIAGGIIEREQPQAY